MSDGITDMYREEKRYEEWQRKRREEGKKYSLNKNATILIDNTGVYIHTGKREVGLGELNDLLNAGVLKIKRAKNSA